MSCSWLKSISSYTNVFFDDRLNIIIHRSLSVTDKIISVTGKCSLHVGVKVNSLLRRFPLTLLLIFLPVSLILFKKFENPKKKKKKKKNFQRKKIPRSKIFQSSKVSDEITWQAISVAGHKRGRS